MRILGRAPPPQCGQRTATEEEGEALAMTLLAAASLPAAAEAAVELAVVVVLGPSSGIHG